MKTLPGVNTPPRVKARAGSKARAAGGTVAAVTLALAFAATLSAQAHQGSGQGQIPQAAPADTTQPPRFTLEGVTVTARRVEEEVQDVPIPISVIDGDLMDRSGAFNTHRLQQMVPSIQFFTSNQRNSFLNIRGQGLPFGLTNDGIEPGVGLYVDGVFYARPASATLDFIDVERIEVLRGPQGTLYGKNTTAGALNATTRVPSFTTTEGIFEVSAGNIGYVQAKGAVSGPFNPNFAGRLSFVSTKRDGLLLNVRTNERVNTLDNIGVKGQLRWRAADGLFITGSGDLTRQRPVGYAQVIAGVAEMPNLAPNRRFEAIAADLDYALPSTNPFDRVIDHNSRWGGGQNLGGLSLTADWEVGAGQLTSITAWRFWDWDPSNDRDWTGTDFVAVSQAPSRHDQWSQEVRYAAQVSPRLDFVAGLFAFRQELDAKTIEVQGRDSWRWALNPNNPDVIAAGPERLSALLDGRGQTAFADIGTTSAALFGQLQWRITDRLRLLPGIRFNYDAKDGSFEREVYGGADDPEYNHLKTGSAYYFDANISDTNISGQLTGGFAVTDNVNVYGTYATAFKTFGFNLSALPTVGGQPDLSTARISPEDVRHIEFGIKTSPAPGVTANLNAFSTDIRDFQAAVRDPDPSQPRAIIAGVPLVRVRGAELDLSAVGSENVALYASVGYNDGRHVTFPNAIPPLELSGGPERVDISGSALPGLPRWALSFGADFIVPVGLGTTDFIGGIDTSYRSEYSSNTSPSEYLKVDGYALVNARAGLRLADGWALTVWSRNLLNKDYLEQLGAAGNSGLYWGIPGEPRTYGVTVRRGL